MTIDSEAPLMASMTGNIRVEKAPGHDWIVYYLDGDDPDILSMSVFGQMRPEDALSEARYSLDFGGPDYEILAIVRADQEELAPTTTRNVARPS